jgi:CDP-2,3-bis-(O-geranylgeranyl)-sn-glycerol synthase
MDLARLAAEALIFIFPAYCANAMPVLAGGGRPLDFGRKFIDGKPILGQNKTLRGFFAGLIVGTLVGLGETALFGYNILFGLALSIGALFGDLAGAFLKRRLGIAPGGLLPVIDQIDFALGAVLLSLLVSPPAMTVELFVMVLVITLPIHLITNLAAYKLGLKSNPW